MNRTFLTAFLLAGAALSATPAIAKVSMSKGQQICESAAKALNPPPVSARADRQQTRSSDTTITVQLKVKRADNTRVTFLCSVDRETGMATLSSNF